jgi:predicted PurR-regulated permease PerM
MAGEVKDQMLPDQHGLQHPAIQPSGPVPPGNSPSAGRFRLPALAVMIAVGAGVCLLLARPFLSALAWAAALAVVVAPMYRWLLRHLRSANLTAALTVVLLALALVGAVIAVVPGLVNTALHGLQAVQEQIESGHVDQLVQQRPWLKTAWHWIEVRVDLGQAAQNAIGHVTALASSVLQGSLLGLVQVALLLFFLFYFLRDQEAVLQSARSLLPLSPAEMDHLFTWIVDTTYATLCGTVLVGVIQGFLGGLIFWWLGVSAPAFWGLVMGILCVLPVVGPSLVWGPEAILLALGGHWGKAIVLVVWGSIVIGLIGNLLYPILLGRRLRLHTVAVFMAMVGGLFLFGACGFFLGPVTLAATLALVNIWKERAALRQPPSKPEMNHFVPQRNTEDQVGGAPMDTQPSAGR